MTKRRHVWTVLLNRALSQDLELSFSSEADALSARFKAYNTRRYWQLKGQRRFDLLIFKVRGSKLLIAKDKETADVGRFISSAS